LEIQEKGIPKYSVSCIIEGRGIVMDIDYLLWLQSIRQALGSYADLFFNLISFLGIGAVGVIAYIYWCRNKQLGKYLLASFMIGDSLNSTLKNTICAYRPWKRDARVVPSSMAISTAGGYSCPSGHTITATTIFGGVAVKEKTNRKLSVGMIILVLLIGFSRNYLGVHTPQDVLIALAEGILVLFFVQKLFDWYPKKQRNDTAILCIGLCVMAVLIVYTICKTYPMTYDANGALLVDPVAMQADAMKSYGMFAGSLTGWYLEKKYIQFSTDGLTKQKRICAPACGPDHHCYSLFCCRLCDEEVPGYPYRKIPGDGLCSLWGCLCCTAGLSERWKRR
jgi:membrane-associated phospholipid phosphatase